MTRIWPLCGQILVTLRSLLARSSGGDRVEVSLWLLANTGWTSVHRGEGALVNCD